MSDGGKGDDRRPGAPGAYERGFDAIDWGARDREALLRPVRPDEWVGDPGPFEGRDAGIPMTYAP